MTMLGSGVEYGQKVYTWLAKNQGLVKSDLYIRWTENPFSESYTTAEIDEFGNVWSGFSRIELAEIKIDRTENVFRQLSNPADFVKKEDFKNISDFDYDPFKVSNQAGFHTINFHEDSD